MVGFPYYYGDDEGGSFNLKDREARIILFTFLLFATQARPSYADGGGASWVVDEAAKASLSTINPVAAALCAGAGYCLAKGKESMIRGDVPTAGGYFCSAAILLCGEKVTRHVAEQYLGGS